MDAALGAFESALQGFPRERRFLLPALRAAQDTLGHVPRSALNAIAAHLRIAPVEVEGAVDGYSELRRERGAGPRVEVCTGLACWLAGSEALRTELAERLRHDGVGGAVEAIGCAFLCGMAPVVRVDGVPFSAVDGAVDAVVKRIERR